MRKIQDDHLDLTIIIFSILNIIIGFFLVKASAAGHSPFGFYLGILTPIIAIIFYTYRYNKLKNNLIKKKDLIKIFKPTVNILSAIMFISFVLMTMVGLDKFDLEYIQFFGVIVLIFMIPNSLVQLIIYLLFKRKLS